MRILSILRMIINAVLKPKQCIEIDEIPNGRIIDIGGGGEGIIAQVAGERIIAIDKFYSEIREANNKAPQALWMASDARQLPFRDQSMDNATAFFSCMYMSDKVKQDVFCEAHRVLKDGGQLWIWDAKMTAEKPVFALRLKVDVKGKSINTVYGVKAKNQSPISVCALLNKAGFAPNVVIDNKHWFLIKAYLV